MAIRGVVSASVDLSAVKKRFKEFEDFSKGFGKYWDGMCEEIGEMLVSRVRSNLEGHIRSGTLWQSISYYYNGDTIRVYSDPDEFKGEKDGYPVQYYAPWVEEGTDSYIYPTVANAIKFFNWGRKYVRKYVRGQKGIHFMGKTANDTETYAIVTAIAERYAQSMLLMANAISDYKMEYKSKKGNLRGWNLTKRGRELRRR